MIFPWHCYALAQGSTPHPAYRLHKRCEGIAGTKTQEDSEMKGYYKVPFRQVYCDSLRLWLASLIECHIVLKLNPPKFEPIMTQETQ